VTPHQIMQIAVEACVDPRSVKTYLRNLELPESDRKPMRSTTKAWIDKTIAAMNRSGGST
jgi:hypothetical protein